MRLTQRIRAGLYFASTAYAIAMYSSAVQAEVDGSEVPMTSWGQVQALPQPTGGEVLVYGPHPDQFGELFLPSKSSAEPHPVVALIHGGCWLEAFDASYIRPLAATLADAGYAVWNIEYRRVSPDPDNGANVGAGGYAETFSDIATAMDLLQQLAPQRGLDLQRLSTIGHSAGGHLALWAAQRAHLPPDAPFYAAAPVLPTRVVGLAAIADLTTYREGPRGSCHAAVDVLIGGTPDSHPERFEAASPAALPLNVPVVLIQGEKDPIVSADSATRFANKRAQVQVDLLGPAGHFDLVMSEPEPQWAMPNILEALGHR